MRKTSPALLAACAAVLLAGCTSSGTSDDATDIVDDAAPGTIASIVWGGLDAPIRPGSSLGGYCTFNFLFTDNATGKAYIGTAGHCTEQLNETVELAGFGPIGQVVWDSDVSAGADASVDFSLIELDDGMAAQANPAMLGFDGPHGAITLEELAAGDVVNVHGYGLVLGQNDVTRSRSGALVSWTDTLYQADMPAVNGDSGSPLLHGPSGKALGIISHYGIGAVPPSTDEGPLMPFVMDQLHAGGFPVELALA